MIIVNWLQAKSEAKVDGQAKTIVLAEDNITEITSIMGPYC